MGSTWQAHAQHMGVSPTKYQYLLVPGMNWDSTRYLVLVIQWEHY